MNKEHQDINKLTKELLKKSIQKPASSDFNDQLMDKILLAPSPAKLKSNGRNVKRAWLFLIVAVACFLVSTLIIDEYFGGYFEDISTQFRLIVNYVFYGGLALFIPLVLYHFDSLMQTMFLKRNEKLSIA